MKHAHHDGLIETPAVGTRVLARQTDDIHGSEPNEVTGTMFGVVRSLEDVSPLKLQDFQDHGKTPWYVVQWDRATWDKFDCAALEVIWVGGGKCIEIDRDEEYAKCPTPEFNARHALEELLKSGRKTIAEVSADEGGTYRFLEGENVEVFLAEGVLYTLARDYGLRALVGGPPGDHIVCRVLRLAAQHYADTVRKTTD